MVVAACLACVVGWMLGVLVAVTSSYYGAVEPVA